VCHIRIASLETTRSNAEDVEALASEGALAILSTLPAEQRSALRLMLGRPLPHAMRGNVWRAELAHPPAAREFERRQRSLRSVMTWHIRSASLSN
jgi:hypothetical protein